MRWTKWPVAVALASAFVFTGAIGSDEATTKRLAAVAKEKLGSIHAAVLVARGEETVLHEGFGAADADARRAIDRDTAFAIGSITKLFTAAAILRLQQDGKLATGDALGDHLDGVPEDKAKITLHQLLTHTAGLPEYHDLKGEGGDFAPLTKDVALGRILESKLLFAPGARSQYSNSGYTLLAAVVEEASGREWTKYLRERLFAPAGMKDTGFFGEKLWKHERVAIGLGKKRHGDNAPDEWPLTWSTLGNGGIVSTVADLARWCRALEGDAVLDAKRRAQLFEAQVKLPEGGAEGYGWMVGRTPGGESEYEVAGGDDLGFLALLTWRPKSRTLVAITSNSAPGEGALPRVSAALMDALDGK
jgi:CubicO group peptidase (beta-lactamase class C family)